MGKREGGRWKEGRDIPVIVTQSAELLTNGNESLIDLDAILKLLTQ